VEGKIQSHVPNWLPDWKDKEQYPDPDTTSWKQWAWEFLRRNPDYRLDCLKFRGNGDDNETIACKKFGIQTLVCPSKGFEEADSLGLLFSDFFLPDCLNYEDSQAGHALSPKNIMEVIMVFDLNLPIDLQLKAAKKRLELEKDVIAGCEEVSDEEFKALTDPAKRREHTKKYRVYLRILDAFESGNDPRNKDCRNIILKSENPNFQEDYDNDHKRISRNYDDARALRELGYKRLGVLQGLDH